MYCRVRLMRAGLGNRLLPWARCRLFAHTHDAKMFTPFWVNPGLGPLLRGESDPRFYNGIFKRIPADEGLLGSILLKQRLTEVEEPKQITSPLSGDHSRSLFVFHGLGDLFNQLVGREDFLNQEIRAITRQRWLDEADNGERFLIGINVRCGDFGIAKEPDDVYRGAVRTPIPWFVKCLEQVREVLGYNARAAVVSDGTEEELGDLIKQENVVFLKPSNAMTGILTLSRMGMLLGSGGSSFTAWAAFLGKYPVVTHPGQDLAWFGLKGGEDHFVGVSDPANPDLRFLDQVARAGRLWQEKKAA